MSAPEFPAEIVTDAKLRYADLPPVGGRSPGRVAIITLDNGQDHTKPNTFGPAGLQRLAAALDAVEAGEPVVAVAVTGKPFIFAVGADLKGVPSIASREQALQVGQLGHAVFRRLTDSRVPTFALVNGAVLGGGLELALSCHYRTISAGVPAVAFPECFLGLVPAWGGTQLLPNLVGADTAVKMIIENALNQNTMLNGPQAFQLGLADAMFSPADFLERSLDWVAGVVTGQTDPRQRRAEVDRGAPWTEAVDRGRTLVEAKLHGAAPAPYRALDLIETARTGDLAAGYAGEDEALADLVMSEELRAGLYSFDLTQRRAKYPAGAPAAELARQVTKVGIVGAGLMASQLGLLFARRLQVPVVLTDVDPARLAAGVGYVHGEIDKLRGKGRLSPDGTNRLKGLVTGSLDKQAFSDADFVIEAVFEQLEVKQQVLAEVEAHVGERCLLATNTSSLPVTEMAAGLAHPERVVGFHFFNPVAVLPLLEVVRARQTDKATLATALATAKTLKKSAVLVQDAPAFVVNRLLTRFLGEVTRAIDEGTPFEEADAALAPLGLPMSPLMLLALVGPAVALHVAETLHAVFPDRYRVSANLRRLVEAGKPGVYTWEGGRQQVDPAVRQMYEVPAEATPPSGAELRDRALSALAEEIAIMLADGVVAAAADVDLCLLLGAGWPFHLGGITPYLDRIGVSEKVTGARFLPKGEASLPG